MSTCGVDSLPTLKTTRRQLHGLSFNLMVVGPSGIGKTTLINSILNTEHHDPPDFDGVNDQVKLRIDELVPQSTGFKLTIIETKGYNNQLDRSDNYKPIVDYIEAKYQEYSRDELNQENNYNEVADRRVHCCLYMISPTARGLKPIDLVTMKQLHQRVCLIPVIGRSDQLTSQERQSIKKVIMKEISENGIEIYSPREYDLPFAVAASNDIMFENGKRQRVRSYPWGRMYIDRDSDFPALRNLLLKERVLAMLETTDKVHYAKFRQEENDDGLSEFKLKYDRERTSLQKMIDRHLLK